MDTESSSLTPEQGALFIEIVEASLRVQQRQHMFSLLQGPVQYLLPHEVMICGVCDSGADTVKFESFSSTRYFTEKHAEEATSPLNGLIPNAVTAWRQHARPVLFGSAFENRQALHSVAEEKSLSTLELRNLAVHGVMGGGGNVSTIFCFSRMPEMAGSRLAFVLELLVPHLHSALLRTMAGHEVPKIQNSSDKKEGVVTIREQEILQWVNGGKTNWEIAQILDISPLTVKNHVQNILRKLQVQNRRHAGLKATQMGLIKSLN